MYFIMSLGLDLNKGREVTTMKDVIEVERIIEAIRRQVEFQRRCGLNDTSRKIVESLHITLVLMSGLSYEELNELIGIDDLFLFM